VDLHADNKKVRQMKQHHIITELKFDNKIIIRPQSLEAENESLFLDNQKYDDKVYIFVCSILTNNSFLTLLSLEYNEIGNKGGKAIAELLKKHKTLKILKLNNNQIGNEGITAITASLMTNAILMELQLQNNQFDDIGSEAIRKLLETNTTLHVIWDEKSIYKKNDGNCGQITNKA